MCLCDTTVSLCVFINMGMCHMYFRMQMGVSVYTCIHVYECLCLCMTMHVYQCLCFYVNKYIFVYECVHVYECVCLCMSVCFTSVCVSM